MILRSFILISTCLAASFYVQAQTITELEYFFNTDPGVGMGVEIPVSEIGDDLEVTASINTEGLSLGMHTLFIRVKNDSGEWGLPIKKLIFVDRIDSNEEQQVTGFEYFFDTDPGVGNGIPLEVASDNDAELMASLDASELSRGMHTLFIRAKQQDDVWGLPIKKLVFVDQSDPQIIGEIVAGEYFLNTDPGFADATPFTIEAGTDVEATFTIPGSNLPVGDQILFVRVQDEFGRWGMYSSFTFNLLEVPFVELIESDSLSISVANAQIPVLEDLALSGSVGINIDSAYVALKSGFISEEDSLFIEESDDFDFEVDQSMIKVFGTGTPEEYQAVFNTVKYKNVGVIPTDTVKALEFLAFSQGLETNNVTRFLDVKIDSIATSNDFDIDIPSVFSLDQNYPNPFNPSSTIQFGLPDESIVRLEVFNLLGQKVADLVNEQMTAGYHAVRFDASALASGIYIYRIQAGSFVQTKKMMLIK